jgi:hypothetical protein
VCCSNHHRRYVWPLRTDDSHQTIYFTLTADMQGTG